MLVHLLCKVRDEPTVEAPARTLAPPMCAQEDKRYAVRSVHASAAHMQGFWGGSYIFVYVSSGLELVGLDLYIAQTSSHLLVRGAG